MSRSLEQHTIDLLKSWGWQATRSTWPDRFSHRQYDLWGWQDVQACHPLIGIMGVQVTDMSNASKRVAKMTGDVGDLVDRWLMAGGFAEVWGWHEYATPDETGRTFRPRIYRVYRDSVEIGLSVADPRSHRR